MSTCTKRGKNKANAHSNAKHAARYKRVLALLPAFHIFVKRVVLQKPFALSVTKQCSCSFATEITTDMPEPSLCCWGREQEVFSFN